ncbi:hypothetical protein BH23CHL8_BH23CHL8_12710 [soil metagenome]
MPHPVRSELDSTAGILVNGDGNCWFDVFVWNRKEGGIKRVSLRRNGSESNEGNSPSAISADGRFVAFNAWGPLVSGDNNRVDDIYLRGPLR